MVSTCSIDGKNYYYTKVIHKLADEGKFGYPTSIAVSDLESYLDTPQWGNAPGDLKPRTVLEDVLAYPEHATRICNADLKYPIILVKTTSGELHVADGMHRIAKAFLFKLENVQAFIVSLEQINSAFAFSD